MEYIAERITIDPDMCNGKLTIRGTRLTVSTILGFLSAGETREELLYHYPTLENEDIDACLKYHNNLHQNNVILETFTK